MMHVQICAPGPLSFWLNLAARILVGSSRQFLGSIWSDIVV